MLSLHQPSNLFDLCHTLIYWLGIMFESASQCPKTSTTARACRAANNGFLMQAVCLASAGISARQAQTIVLVFGHWCERIVDRKKNDFTKGQIFSCQEQAPQFDDEHQTNLSGFANLFRLFYKKRILLIILK